MTQKTDWVKTLAHDAPLLLPLPPHDTMIWRYINFPTLVSMLHTKQLFFRRLDQFSDQHEAALSRPALVRLQAARRERAKHIQPSDPIPADVIQVLIEDATEKTAARRRKTTFVNCWHASTHESMAMWQIYSDKGLAIQSTVGDLRNSVQTSPSPILVDWIQYVDHGADDIDEDLPYFFKQKLYSYEREIRAVVYHGTLDQDPGPDQPLGMCVPCALDILMTELRLAPGSGSWFYNAVKSVLAKYGLTDIAVVSSEADRFPDHRVEIAP